ncbi:MAG: formate dehydrogenase subunit alpha [Bacillales bacterium]|jgi:formate dehydrogenase major subunit|nr:formate dehydrogenase subunit alpha [Bacillales bacterium]
MGGNPAENHPISFKYLLKAKQNGGKIVSVDPRFTRSSSQADVYAPLRSGTDIAFLGGMINYAIQNDMIHKDYVVSYTNASFIVEDTFSYEDGLFSGYDAEKRKYDQKQWKYKTDAEGKTVVDKTLQNPRCVYQLMKKHFERYTVEKVCEVTGTPQDKYIEVAKTFCATADPKKAGTIMYAMGTTQHTVGTQNVRSFAILQLLLGNIGVPGGGVQALRGESNVQGSTDFGLLFGNLTGYIEVPQAVAEQASLEKFLGVVTPKLGYWVNKPKFLVSFLKAMYGKSATKDNEFGFQFLPKIDPKDYSHIALFENMYAGNLDGAFLWGTNPVVGGPNALVEKQALGKLKWMVAVDLWETESSSFWQKEAGSNPEDIQTEVFFLPACSSYEKEGTVSNSGRWMQYRWQAIKPKGDSKADLEIVHMLARRLKEAYKGSTKPEDKPFQAMTWEFGEHDHPDIDLVAKEINGYDTVTGKLVAKFPDLKDDGTTSSGNWIYCGFYPEEGKNLSQRRDNKDTGMSNFLNWSFSWPVNRRILYNRASCDPSGKPYNEKNAIIWWDESAKAWGGYDVPDFNKLLAPSDEGGATAFMMTGTTKGNLFAPRNEGPFPEHYEPFESPVQNAFSSQQINPAIKIWDGDHNPRGNSEKFPIVATTYRMSEHWQSGAMTRNTPWLAELVPHMLIEISEELAKDKGIKDKDKVKISSARGEIEAYAVVTKRFKPYTILGKTVHQIGMIWHFGYKGIVTGASANNLTPHIGDANTNIPEYKAFLCDVRRA